MVVFLPKKKKPNSFNNKLQEHGFVGVGLLLFMREGLGRGMGHTPVTEGSSKEFEAGSSCELGHYVARSLNLST